MGWQSHFSFAFTVTGQFGKALHCEQAFDVKTDIPMDELFASQFSSDVRSLSLNHRKVLWMYKNIPEAVWTRTARELAKMIRQHPASTVTVKTSRAGVAVALVMLDQMGIPADKQVHFQFEAAPLEWLEKHFAPVKASYSVETSAMWPQKSRRAA